MFGQQQKKGSYENTGVGLGLAYCKMVTEKMNGEIECISAENKGTIISFYITAKCSFDDHGLSKEDYQKYKAALNKKIL